MWEGLSRAELSVMVKTRQRKIRNAELKELKRKVKATGVKDILPEIMEHKAVQAGKLKSLPRPALDYTTAALNEAAHAASLADTPKPEALSPMYKAALARANERQAAEVVAMSETPGSRYRRWLGLNRLINLNAPVKEQDRAFHETYQLSTEYKAMCEREEMIEAVGN